MQRHLTANLWLLTLTILICSIAYPAVLLVIGQTVFHDRAQGSMIEVGGKPVGSRLIAQPFVAEEYFHPRPSAVSYNAAGAGGSNWGANNPALRKRVVAALGPNLKYRDGRPVGPDIASWVRENLKQHPEILAQWSKDDAGLAERWAAADQANADFLAQWAKDHEQEVAALRRGPSSEEGPNPAELAALFFESFAQGKTKSWPETSGLDFQTAFFEIWWKAHPNAEVQPVPADMVMASGAGLDPHITLDNALYQLDRVAGAWAKKTNQASSQIHREIEKLLRDNTTAPLGGTVGVPLVNVLETNLALSARYGGQ